MNRYIYNEQTFTLSNHISYYLLGCYLTDGCIYNTVFEITSKDKDWLELIRLHIAPKKPIETNKNCWRLRGCNVTISNWLKSNNCINNKSLILKFPKIPKQYLPDLIRGLIDGDGSISITRNTIYLCSASQSFIKSFCDILQKQNIKYNFYERKGGKVNFQGRESLRKSSLFKVSIWGKNSYKFLKWIYYSNNVLCMPRKHELAKNIINLFEERGLTLNNLESFNTNQNRDSNKLKINNDDLFNILSKWFNVPQEIRNVIGYRKQFYNYNIKNNYNISYHYMNRLLNGKQRQNLFSKYLKKS